MGHPVVIHVGPDGPIDAVLARMFQANGHRAVCHDGGRLAADIVYAMGQGTQPLRGWPNARLITGLYRDRPHWRPHCRPGAASPFCATVCPTRCSC